MSCWIDTHCHLDAAEFEADRDGVRAAARAAGVAHLVVPAVERANWSQVMALAHRHGDSYALGIHPLYTPRAREQDIAALREMLKERRDDPHLVAVGEIGLDFFVPGLDAGRQAWFYEQQIRLAREFDLPVILHVRKSSDHLLKTLRALKVKGGIAHAFNGSVQQAQAFIALGFRLGFGGAVTYDRALRLRELAASLPLQALVMETDAPDIPPHWLYTTAEQRAQGRLQGRNSAHCPGNRRSARHGCGAAGGSHQRQRAPGAARPAGVGEHRVMVIAASSPAADTRWQGLAPVADARTRALVLGSFPGLRSLQLQQYYAHPQNQFWPLLQALWPQHPQPPREDYAGRCEWLLARGLGLWDVYASCEREGSLDSAIRAAQANDIAGLKMLCPQLTLALHNGGESFKHARQTRAMGLQALRLPSTSPANAGWSFEKKLQAWHDALAMHSMV